METSEDHDLSTIAWPGFVDILSAVIIMFVFFLLIVATALYFHILIFKSQRLATPDESIDKVMTTEEVVMTQTQSEFAESDEQSVSIDSSLNEMVLYFGKDSISIKARTVTELKEALQPYIDGGGAEGYTIRVTATKNPESFETAARKIAVARLLNVRNLILDTGFKPEIIEVSVIDPLELEESYHWVKIELEER
jgi:hypothetical protein